MVIDDGSTDNTKELIKSWMEQDILDIEYHYKKNGGVHTARDLAYRLVQTELIVGVDSDDWITKDAIEAILKCWAEHGGPNAAGIMTPVCTPEGMYYGKVFPPIDAASYQDITYLYKNKNEKLMVIRSDIIKRIPDCPVYEEEYLVGEGFKWIQLPDLPFLILHKPLRVYNIRDDGIVANARRNFFLNSKGFRENYRQHIIHSKYLASRIKGHIGYILMSIYLKDKGYIRTSPKPLATLLLFPAGIVAYWYAKLKWMNK